MAEKLKTMVQYNTLTDVENDCKRLMKQHLKWNWSFRWSSAKRQFGSCYFRRNNLLNVCENGNISLSKTLVSLNLNKFKVIRDTILHEIAHAIEIEKYGSTAHGNRWKQITISIGCSGERTYNSNELEMPKAKYTYVCIYCSREVNVHRKYKRIKACGKCCRKYNNGKFSLDYKLELM